MCLHRLHRGSRMVSSCVIICSSCFFSPFYLISWDFALFHFHYHLPCFDPDDEAGGPLLHLHIDSDKGRFFSSFFFNIHISQCHRVTYCDLSDPSIQTFLSIILTVLPMSVGDVMVWPDHSHSNISRFVLQIPSCLSVPSGNRKRITAAYFAFCFTFIHRSPFFFSNWL